MPPTVADTSWLVALFHSSEVHHEEAVNQAATAGGCIVPTEVLTEFLGVHVRRARANGREGPAEARKALKGILAAGFAIATTEPTDALLRFFDASPELSYPDCAALWHARGGRLLSFDHDQHKALAAFERA